MSFRVSVRIALECHFGAIVAVQEFPSQLCIPSSALPMSEAYWTVSSGVASRTGHSCRECRKVISKGEAIKIREGRKMRFSYHEGCFSGKLELQARCVRSRLRHHIHKPTNAAQQGLQTRAHKKIAHIATKICPSAPQLLLIKAMASGPCLHTVIGRASRCHQRNVLS